MKRQQAIKLISVLLLSVMMLFCLPLTSFAALPNNDTISPQWDSISYTTTMLAFDGTTGCVTGRATKQSTADRIEGTLYLYKLVDGEWEYMNEWYKSKTVGTLLISEMFEAEVGVTYKAVWEITAYTDDVPESDTTEFTKTCTGV